jgi:hypothetical protein
MSLPPASNNFTDSQNERVQTTLEEVAQAPPRIKFSHIYDKHGKLFDGLGVKKAYLVAVQRVKPEDLPDVFLAYDTRYHMMDGRRVVAEHYPIDFKDGLLLIFFAPEHEHLFPTIRRRTAEKERWYKSQLNKLFDVVMG